MNALGPTPAVQAPSVRSLWPDRAGTLMRWILGALFVYMGWTKAVHPELFLKLLRQYDLTSQSLLLNLIAATLPWFEVVCGVLLLAGVAVRGTALLVILMLVPFTVVVFERALAVADLQHIAFCAVSFDCGCGNGEVLICRKLVENAALVFLAGWLVAGFGRPLAAWFALADRPVRN
jgi:uncharacterized membrane protein YphA (DoxX/SURF4 family)